MTAGDDVTTGGHPFLTACASLMPFSEPGISMSVKTNSMSARAFKISSASSARLASIASKPAASMKSTASIRTNTSSSTTRTTRFGMACAFSWRYPNGREQAVLRSAEKIREASGDGVRKTSAWFRRKLHCAPVSGVFRVRCFQVDSGKWRARAKRRGA
jgi:hypothetical protein